LPSGQFSTEASRPFSGKSYSAKIEESEADYSWRDGHNGLEFGETFRHLSAPIQWTLVSVLMEGRHDEIIVDEWADGGCSPGSNGGFPARRQGTEGN
jgi:hypothetical protein